MSTKILVSIILSLAFVLRILGLQLIPIGFTPDEASFGYDAYSILSTGKDQWGYSYPLVLESFGDFKPPLYSYLTIPSVWLFGLNKFAVRLPSALLGTFAVLFTYLFVKELLRGGDKNLGHKVGLFSSLLLAISPWHVMMSRGAFEASLTTFILPASIYFFLKGLKEKKYLVVSAIGFGLNLFSYHSARIISPLIVFLLIFLHKEDLLKLRRKHVLLPGLVFVFFLTLAFSTLFYGSATRAKDISIFSGALQQAADQRTIALSSGLNPTFSRLFHNKYQVVVERFITNYSQYFSFKFLFLDGPAEATYGMIPGRGVLYWTEIPLLLGFLYSLFRFKNKKPLIIIAFWLLISPVPAALTLGKGYAANRASIMLPAITIALGIGAYSLSELLKAKVNILIFRLIRFGYLTVFSLFFLSFVKDYFYISPYISSKEMLSGNLETAYWLKEHSVDKSEIIVSRSLSEPHIYIAFANAWDPISYQVNSVDWQRYKQENLKFLDQLAEYRLGKYVFKNINYMEDQKKTDIYLVGKVDDFPQGVKPVYIFRNPNGEVNVLVVDPLNQAYAQKIN